MPFSSIPENSSFPVLYETDEDADALLKPGVSSLEMLSHSSEMEHVAVWSGLLLCAEIDSLGTGPFVGNR